MDAQDLGVQGQGRRQLDGVHRLADGFDRLGEGRREESGDAAAGLVSGDLLQAVDVRVHHFMPQGAVKMDIDEAGRDPGIAVTPELDIVLRQAVVVIEDARYGFPFDEDDPAGQDFVGKDDVPGQRDLFHRLRSFKSGTLKLDGNRGRVLAGHVPDLFSVEPGTRA